VWQVGAGYLIGFRGEVNADTAAPRRLLLAATGATSAIGGLLRTDGLTYTGVERLDLTLGRGDDVLNVRGTTAVTGVDAAGGDDRVYVSSTADVALTGHPDLLGGVLDDILGSLNLQFGTGHGTLLVSDLDARAGDADVLVTDRIAAARDRDADVAAWAEIAMLGLAAGSISYAAAATGDLAGGIRLWTGYGADHLTVDGSFARAGRRTTTWLNTGLGDDTVLADLTAGQDGNVVLNLQGPDRSRPDAADDDTLDASASSLPLVVFGGQGDDTITTGSGADTVLGDHGLVLWFAVDAVPDLTGLANGVLSAAEYAALAAAAVGLAGWGGPGDFSTNAETLVGLVLATDALVAGDDSIATGGGNDVAIGGTGADSVSGGAGDDVLLGDLGWVATTLSLGALRQRRVASFGDTSGGADTLRGDAGDDLAVGGAGDERVDGGAGSDLLFGDNARIDQAWSLTATGWHPSFLRLVLLDHDVLAQQAAVRAFGDDYLAGGAGADVIFGELGDDTIQGDGSIDLEVGAARDAAGHLVLHASELRPDDGDDYIEAGGGDDVVFGNGGSDDIVGGSSAVFSLADRDSRPDGRDVLFGGAGTLAGRNDDTAGNRADSDVLVGDNGYVLRATPVSGILADLTGVGGAAAQLFGDRLLRVVVLLDHTAGGPDSRAWLFPRLTQAQVATAGTGLLDVWGADELHGEAGDDALYGGGGNDVLYGDAGNDGIVGGWGHDWISGGTGSDVIFGDDEWTEGLNLDAEQPKGVAFSSDVIYGGWDDDVVDGGYGDDLVSGAEALATSWALDAAGQLVESGWDRPFNDGGLLGFGRVKKGEFALFLRKKPNRRIMLCGTGVVDPACAEPLQWLANFDPADGRTGGAGLRTDGADLLIGRAGNDWLVGGTGIDTLWGGRGRDIVNADDDQGGDAGENRKKDRIADHRDVLLGGVGDDEYLRDHKAEKVLRTNGGRLVRYQVPMGGFRGGLVTVRAPRPLVATFARAAQLGGPLVARVDSAGQAWLATLDPKSAADQLGAVVVDGVRVIPLQANFLAAPDPAALARWLGALWAFSAQSLGAATPALTFVGVVGPLAGSTPLSGLRVSCQAGNRYDLAAGGCVPLASAVALETGVCSAGEGEAGDGCGLGPAGVWWLWHDPAAGADPLGIAQRGPVPGCGGLGGAGSADLRGLVRDDGLCFTPSVRPL
jgi:Ca2+-binding RTX toxin-like protein